jgi:hypothetical protein
VERLDVEGITLYWIAKTMFMTADVGIWVEIGPQNGVPVSMLVKAELPATGLPAAELPAAELPAAELPILVTGANSGVVLVTGTAGGTR